MPTSSFPLTADEIAKALGCPGKNVRKYWPAIQAACREKGMTDVPSTIAVLATVATEVSSFCPINEYGGAAYFTKNYELDRRRARDLGNTQPGDGARFHGRGFIQVTGRYNYTNYGRALGVPLAENPDLALEPSVASRILAQYFADRKIPADARKGDWRAVRRKVNGGYNGWDDFIRHVESLQRAVQAKKKTADPLGRPELREGMRHPAVKQLKAAIGPWIQANVKGPQPQFDRTTVFGPGLGDAVEIFQRMNKLKPDRIVGPKVWAALDRVSKQARGRPPAQGTRATPAAKTAKAGSKSRAAAKPRSPA